MGRIRTIKPDFFLHEGLFDLEKASGLPVRLAYAGLWTQSDREGRFRWKPRTLKSQILPHDNVDFEKVLDTLASQGFIVRYQSAEEEFGHIPSWERHQNPNQREASSVIPDPRTCTHMHAPVERKGKERKGKEGGHPSDVCSEPPKDGDSEQPSADQAAIMVFPCVGRGPTEWPLTAVKVEEYRQSYPAVDVLGECRKALQWCRDNKAKRKTFVGMPAFLNRWMGQCQNRGGSNGNFGKTGPGQRYQPGNGDPEAGVW